MSLRKLYNLREMNSFQVIAVTGLVMTLLAHLVLNAVHKVIPDFEMLYLCWAILFVGGYLRNVFAKPDDHHHHH
ncbi:hypothetical protein [Adhaeribacter soli]|uniref:Uncharacterized protein n=1 Tax=Adhaeribacter soli TaxID=2607655 RepID=A0A5N1J7I0_9BACT|nr:hypothetical protein [Adhaeribacter soli]KAA9345922.1 hypothetical protein F0P94_02235 [Adhaeribacter soli]